MNVRYHSLRGMRVKTSDGCNLGRVADLVAERRGDDLCVIGLLVGAGGVMRRVIARRLFFHRLAPPRFIPWELVGHLDRKIVLSADLCDLEFRKMVPRQPPMSSRRQAS